MIRSCHDLVVFDWWGRRFQLRTPAKIMVGRLGPQLEEETGCGTHTHTNLHKLQFTHFIEMFIIIVCHIFT